MRYLRLCTACRKRTIVYLNNDLLYENGHDFLDISTIFVFNLKLSIVTVKNEDV